MIQVEERQLVDSPDPPPVWNPGVLSLMTIAGLTLVIGLVPWERSCVFRGSLSLEPATPLCFSARIWSGSASLFGLLAMVLAAVFLGASLTRGWYRKRSVGTGCLALATGFVTALAIKVTVVLVDSGFYHRAQSPTYQPQSVGVWLGLVVAVMATTAVVFVFAGRMASVRAWEFAGLTILTLSAVGAIYAWSGLAWWGGPLANPMALGGGSGMMAPVRIDKLQLFDGLLFVRNDSHVAATLDGVDLVGAPAGFHVSDAYIMARCNSTLAHLEQCGVRLDGWVAHPGPTSDHSVAVTYRVSGHDVYRIAWFRIRYHVGAFHFEVFRTEEFAVCGFSPREERCHIPGT